MSSIPEENPEAAANVSPLSEETPSKHVAQSESLAENLPEEPQLIEPPVQRLFVDDLALESPIFESWYAPEHSPSIRIPHLGHLALLAALVFLGGVGSLLLTGTALHFHLFGVSTLQQANNDIHYTLGSEAVLYLLALAGCLAAFPQVWRQGFFAGIHWQAAMGWRYRRRLFAAAFVCFLLALLNGILMPGPTDTPIDKIFRIPGAAWFLFAFGVTFAPFFEEILFRGFLLPSLATACDWIADRITHSVPRPLDQNGHPQWSFPAMAIASVATSIPFALMHAEQTGHALGPFLLLICVSLVLCWARLSTRSLAASVIVHACYNFLLFSLMLLGTGGFRHLEKM